MEEFLESYKTRGLARTLAAAPGYLRWLLEYRVLARLLYTYVTATGGTVSVEGLEIDVTDPVVGAATTYRIYRGVYEKEERQLIAKYLKPSLDVVELGGGIGVTACHANRLLEPDKTHVVVEANEQLVPTIERNRDRNDCEFSVRTVAYDPQADTVVFETEEAFESGRVVPGGSERDEIPAVSLKQLVTEHDVEEFALVADIEGLEFDLFERELPVLADRCRLIIVECHPKDDDSIDIAKHQLRSGGFQFVDKSGPVLVFRRGAATKTAG